MKRLSAALATSLMLPLFSAHAADLNSVDSIVDGLVQRAEANCSGLVYKDPNTIKTIIASAITEVAKRGHQDSILPIIGEIKDRDTYKHITPAQRADDLRRIVELKDSVPTYAEKLSVAVSIRDFTMCVGSPAITGLATNIIISDGSTVSAAISGLSTSGVILIPPAEEYGRPAPNPDETSLDNQHVFTLADLIAVQKQYPATLLASYQFTARSALTNCGQRATCKMEPGFRSGIADFTIVAPPDGPLLQAAHKILSGGYLKSASP